jgi:hypothetical protein
MIDLLIIQDDGEGEEREEEDRQVRVKRGAAGRDTKYLNWAGHDMTKTIGVSAGGRC